MVIDDLGDLGILDAIDGLAHLVMIDEHKHVTLADLLYECRRLDAILLENHRALGRQLAQTHGNVLVIGIGHVLEVGVGVRRHDRVVIGILVSNYVDLCHENLSSKSKYRDYTFIRASRWGHIP